jgi:hypothetical protein
MAPNTTLRFVEAEVKCYHCGMTAGVLRREDGVTKSPLTFRAGRGQSDMMVSGLTALRCTQCHGPLFTDSVEIVYEYPLADEPFERPRRGRPPKRRDGEETRRSA